MVAGDAKYGNNARLGRYRIARLRARQKSPPGIPFYAIGIFLY
jgi:hypothetical protein